MSRGQCHESLIPMVPAQGRDDMELIGGSFLYLILFISKSRY